jgi:hypothetical protein
VAVALVALVALHLLAPLAVQVVLELRHLPLLDL